MIVVASRDSGVARNFLMADLPPDYAPVKGVKG